MKTVRDLYTAVRDLFFAFFMEFTMGRRRHGIQEATVFVHIPPDVMLPTTVV